MTEATLSAKRAAALALLAGVALAWLALFGGVVAVVGVLLAQPLLSLAVSWQRGTRALSPEAVKRGFPSLLLVWTLLFAVAAALVAWPLKTVLVDARLMAVLGLSAAVGVVIIGVWRSWPLWHGLLRGTGTLAELKHLLGSPEVNAWRGLGVAGGVALALFAGIAMAWPGLLPEAVRTGAVAVYALALPGLHWLIQRVAAPEVRPATLKIVSMPVSAEPVLHVPEPEGDPDAALYEAARTGRVERALEWLEAGADPYALPLAEARDQRSLGVLAAVLPDLRLLRALIAAGLDVNHAHAGMTPLLAATRDSWHGRPDAVTTLLANGADPRATDTEGNTPLHHAARSSDPGVVALLLDATAEIDALNHEGRTPLGIACVAGNWRLAKFLLQHGARPDPASGLPVLLAAAATEEDDPAGVQLLLKHKAKLDARDAEGRSALHEAAFAGHADIVSALLAAGADVQARDQRERTPWLAAARGGQAGVLDALAQAGADALAVDAEGCNALVVACSGTTVPLSLVQRLLAAGVDPAQPDNQGRHAVNLAAEAGRWAVVSALDPAYPLPAAVAIADDSARPDRSPASLILEALGNDTTEGLEALAALCSPEELGRLLHEPGLSPAQQSWLLRNGASAEARNAQGDTPLFAALTQGLAGMATARMYLQRGISPAGRGGLARYLAASVRTVGATGGAQAFALELLERGADPFGASAEGDTPLSLAVRLDWLQLLDRLLDIGVDREFRDGHGMTALHLAAALGREAALKQLVKKGASPEARAADGQTPLGISLASGRRDLADWLEWRGWKLPRRALRPADLPAAAMAGDRDAVRRLLDFGFEVDAVDVQGCSALLRAAGGGHRAVAELLIARGANLEHAASTGATPLSAAVSMRHADLVTDLLAAGAQIEHRLPGGVTVLMLASALGLPDITARLLASGADVHAGDAQELAPLHCAALFGFVARDRVRLLALFDALLLAGAEPERVAAGAVTPLLLLLGARAEPGTAHDEEVVMAALERLLEEGISLDVQDPRGFGPLHLAALHGMLRVVQRLLRAGADPDLRDALNRPPREIAVMRGFIDVAAEFTPAVPGASMARFLREPRG